MEKNQKKYNKLYDECKENEISYEMYRDRRKRGWSHEDAIKRKKTDDNTKIKLMAEKRRVPQKAFGKEFKSIAELSKYYDIPENSYRGGLKRGQTPEETIQSILKHRYNAIDFSGNKFKSVEDMCDFHKINRECYYSRIKRGWTQEETLMIKQQLYFTSIIFEYNNETFFNWSCPVCKQRHILSAPEIRQHYLQHIKKREVEG